MNAAGVVLDTFRVTIEVEWLTRGFWNEPVIPLLEELEDGEDPDAEDDGDDDDLVHVRHLAGEEVSLTGLVMDTYHSGQLRSLTMEL